MTNFTDVLNSGCKIYEFSNLRIAHRLSGENCSTCGQHKKLSVDQTLDIGSITC